MAGCCTGEVSKVETTKERVDVPGFCDVSWCPMYVKVVELEGGAIGFFCRDHGLSTEEKLEPEVEPYCNHDAVAVVDGVCECGARVT
jgi:hypothetical protein